MLFFEIDHILGISLFTSLLFYIYSYYRIHSSVYAKKEKTMQPSSNEIYLKPLSRRIQSSDGQTKSVTEKFGL